MEERRILNDQLHRRYGHSQFASGEYEEAMAHFGMCSDASPVVLLRLFPSLVSSETLKPMLPDTPGTVLSSLLCLKGYAYQSCWALQYREDRLAMTQESVQLILLQARLPAAAWRVPIRCV